MKMKNLNIYIIGLLTLMSATWLREMLILHSRITITEVCIM